MTVNEKMKTVDHKIKKRKAKHNLDRQKVKISALSPGYFGKYEFLTGENILPRKELLGQAATIKRFEYSPVGSELKKQASIGKYHYQRLDKKYVISKKNIAKTEYEKRIKSGLLHSNNFTFFKHR